MRSAISNAVGVLLIGSIFAAIITAIALPVLLIFSCLTWQHLTGVFLISFIIFCLSSLRD
jgi:uncharacterized protein (DUF983 family)